MKDLAVFSHNLYPSTVFWSFKSFYFLRRMANEEDNRKRKADEGIEGESSRQSLKVIDNNDLLFDPYVNARQAFHDAVYIPANFTCPLSKTIMSDPVNLSTGQTVDRSAFENLFDILPDDLIDQVTGIENLSSAILTPNVELRTRIEKWHEDKRKAKLRFQLKMMSYSPEYQVASARELRAMVKDFPPYAEAFVDLGPSAILELFRPLLANDPPTHGSVHEDILVTAMLLSKYHPGNRQLLVHHPAVIDIILESLRCGSLLAKLSTVTLVYYITAVPGCRGALVSAGIMKLLAELMQNGSVSLIFHAVNALCELCNVPEYRHELISHGIIKSISDHLLRRNLTENLSCLLDQLLSDKVGHQQLAESWIIHEWLLNTIRKTSSSKVTEICLVILSRILPISEAAFATTFKHEMKYHLITKVVEAETTQKSKETAQVILKSFTGATTSHRAARLSA